MLASLTVLCVYACTVCVEMSDIDSDGAIIEPLILERDPLLSMIEPTQPTDPRCDCPECSIWKNKPSNEIKLSTRKEDWVKNPKYIEANKKKKAGAPSHL